MPQYYVENSHPAIIGPAEWKLVQRELECRKAIGRSYSGNSIFSSRLVCGDCGGYFGSKVWHSTDKYQCTIWRCNSKFTGEEKCQTPHLTEEKIKSRFLDTFNALVANLTKHHAVSSSFQLKAPQTRALFPMQSRADAQVAQCCGKFPLHGRQADHGPPFPFRPPSRMQPFFDSHSFP